MTKFKTVKDLEWEYPINALRRKIIFPEELRQEIIRFLKELRKHTFYCLICEKFECDCSSSDCFKPRSETIEHFFRIWLHITKEDLKEKKDEN